jgi:hypothetical protein
MSIAIVIEPCDPRLDMVGGIEPIDGGTGLSLEYWKRTVAVEPPGLTEPLSVAPFAETDVAAAVVTTGTVDNRMRLSSASTAGALSRRA